MSEDAYEILRDKANGIARTIAGHLAMGASPTADMIDDYRAAHAAEEAEIDRRTREMYSRLAVTPVPCPICKQIPETLRINDEYITSCERGDLPGWIESATSEDEFPMLACATAAESVADWNGYVHAYTRAQREATE